MAARRCALTQIEDIGAHPSGSMALDPSSDHSNFQVPGFAGGWQSHMVQTLASFGDGNGGLSQGGVIPNDEGLQEYVLAGNLLPHN